MIAFWLSTIVCSFLLASAFTGPSAKRVPTSRTTLNAEKWPGTRPPIENPEFLKQKMDAAWGRGKYRSEVWDDDVNPLNDWWKAYEPTSEEVEAAEAGFDFGNPKAWCEANGIDFEKASAELELAQTAAAEKAAKEEEELSKYDILETQQLFFKLLNRAYLISLREEDNKNQILKGQPSLDVEDTGVQWKNDP